MSTRPLTAAFIRKRVPDESVRLLLRSALLPDTPAWEAWLEWRRRTDVENLRDASISLLPFLLKRWDSRIKEDALYPVMKGIYRRTWYKNQMLLEQGRKVAEELRASGIPVLYLKGLASLLSIHGDPGVRVMKDLDVLVPFSEADRAIEILKSLGFVYREVHGYAFIRRYSHGCEFYSENLGKVDLHWHAFHDFHSQEADRPIWEHSLAADLKGVPVQIPDPLHFLVHVLLASARCLPAPDCRWVIDAALTIRGAGKSLDWESLLQMASEPLKTLPLRDTLTYLDSVVEGLVPAGVLDRLHSIPVNQADARYYEWGLKPILMYGSRPFFRNFIWMWNNYTRVSRKCHGGRPLSWTQQIKGYPSFLKLRFKTSSYTALLALWLRKTLKKPCWLWE